MFKLTVVGGPQRGKSFAVDEGTNTIGRQEGNQIILKSDRVSKRHCVLVVSNGQVLMKDPGSANGTFVNGQLTRKKVLRSGDRLSVGEYVLELNEPKTRFKSGNVISFPQQQGMQPGFTPMPGGSLGGEAESFNSNQTPPAPKDLKGKLKLVLDQQILPVFYGINLKTEWRVLSLSLLFVYIVSALLISVYPLLEGNDKVIVKEVGRRAKFFAQMIADRNASALAGRQETKTEISSLIENEQSVRLALLTDLDNRIIAPASKMNQYLTSGPIAALATRARERFQSGVETGMIKSVDGDVVVAIEPVRIISSQAGRNITVAMAIVAVDTSVSLLDGGEVAIIYSETFIILAIVGLLMGFIIYRVTLHPFEVLNDDIDRVLKGDIPQVTQEFQIEELRPLWEVINSTLQRVNSSKSGGSDLAGSGGGSPLEDWTASLRMLGETASFGLLLCDGERNIVYMNGLFEDQAGVRLDSSGGQNIAAVVRDQAFGVLCSDLFDRASGGTVIEEFEFSGIKHAVKVTAVANAGGQIRGYTLSASKVEES